MARFIDDQRQLDVFSHIAQRAGSPIREIKQSTIGIIEWPRGVTTVKEAYYQSEIERVGFGSLFESSEPALRVIFAPIDSLDPETADLTRSILHYYDIPTAFVTARLQAVTHAYGTRTYENDRHAAWFQVLCKNINTEDVDGRRQVVDPRPNYQHGSQAEGTWIKQKFFLSWGVGKQGSKNTTLICFGAHEELENRFLYLSANEHWRECVDSPFTLLVIILDELFQMLDNQVWKILEVIGDIEMDILNKARAWNPEGQFDFVGLHNVSKHVSHLIESTSAMLSTAEEIYKSSLDLPGTLNANVRLRSSSELSHQIGMLRSVSLRLASVEKRLENSVNLAFHLVTQIDSKILQRDSYSMKTIAAVTLFFLPISTVAAIFGTQFFNFEPGRHPQDLEVSQVFWLFWVISVSVTIVSLGVWYFYHDRSTKKMAGLEPYTWRSLRHRYHKLMA